MGLVNCHKLCCCWLHLLFIDQKNKRGMQVVNFLLIFVGAKLELHQAAMN
jgi:hypothetical protein